MKWIRSNLKLSPEQLIRVSSTFQILNRVLEEDPTSYLLYSHHPDLVIYRNNEHLLGALEITPEEEIYSEIANPKVWSCDQIRVVGFQSHQDKIIFKVDLDLAHRQGRWWECPGWWVCVMSIMASWGIL